MSLDSEATQVSPKECGRGAFAATRAQSRGNSARLQPNAICPRCGQPVVKDRFPGWRSIHAPGYFGQSKKIECSSHGLSEAQGQESKFERGYGRRLMRLTSPNQSWIRIRDEAGGRIAEVTDCRGRTVRSSYDEQNRPTACRTRQARCAAISTTARNTCSRSERSAECEDATACADAQ
jgi:YD repeat-containing protein